jgi:hypothetical protein
MAVASAFPELAPAGMPGVQAAEVAIAQPDQTEPVRELDTAAVVDAFLADVLGHSDVVLVPHDEEIEDHDQISADQDELEEVSGNTSRQELLQEANPNIPWAGPTKKGYPCEGCGLTLTSKKQGIPLRPGFKNPKTGSGVCCVKCALTNNA